MDATTATLIGTSIGTLGGLAGGLLTLIAQNRQVLSQQQADDARRRADIRREACDALVSAARQFVMHWWQIDYKLRRGIADEALVEATVPLWVEVATAHSRVAIAGPDPVAASADSLLAALSLLDKEGTKWFQGVQEGDGEEIIDTFREAYEDAYEAFTAKTFADVARKALSNTH
ncbi:hypothetical protein ACIP2Z_06815 [Streptomyces iakyrus]|uniref:Secreted protein n=1 Tax=Streptomyces iakyrus TaxID=68219 RepID=A0ABW8F9C4_9ACTN